MNRGYSRDPLEQFQAWFEAADSDAMALATASRDGAPSARIVLLKGADERGFVFFTSYESRKGRELAENPRASLLFHWPGKQVRIEGSVERLSAAESDGYWMTRPRESQLAAWSSHQSEPISSRHVLERRYASLTAKKGDVPRPPFWGGYLLVPVTYEFWEHRENRLHDRIRYTRAGESWKIERLSP